MPVGMGIEVLQGKENLFIYPLMEAFSQTNLTIIKIFSMASYLLYGFFIINLSFQCIKLWVGTTEVKKMAVDAIYKIVIVTLLWNAYFPLRNLCLTWSTELGTKLSGGYDGLMQEYAIILTDTERKIKEASRAYELILKKAVEKNARDENGLVTAVSADSLKDYVMASGLTTEQAIAKLNNLGVKVVSQEEIKTGVETKSTMANGGDTVSAYNSYDMQEFSKTLENYFKDVDKRRKKIAKKRKEKWDKEKAAKGVDYLDDPDFHNTLATVRAYADLLEVVDSNSGVPTDSEIGLKFKQYCYNLFFDVKEVGLETRKTRAPIKGFGNTIGVILNPMALIKAVELNTKVVQFKKLYANNGTAANAGIPLGDEDDKVKLSETNSNRFVNKFIEGIFAWINDKLLYISVVILTVQYIVAIVEFLIVSSIGIVFVPMLYFDGTKQYGTKLVSLWVNYFFKFFFISLIIIFEFNVALRTSIMLSVQPNSFGNALGAIGAVIFNFVFSIMLANAPEKLANSLLSGQPSLSVGDMAHAMHSATGMARTAQNTARNVAAAPGKIASHTIQPAGRHIGNMVTRRNAAISAANAWNGIHKGDEKYAGAGGAARLAADTKAKQKQFGRQIMAGQFMGNLSAKLTGTTGTRGFRVKGEDGKYHYMNGTGMGSQYNGDFQHQNQEMNNLAEKIAGGEKDHNGQYVTPPKEQMAAGPGDLEGKGSNY